MITCLCTYFLSLLLNSIDMWYGGNHVGRWGSSSITNMYADGVNWHHDLLPNEPKHSHLTKLHTILANNNAALMQSPSQINHFIPLGTTSEGLGIEACQSGDVGQTFTFVNGTIQNGTGFCVDGACPSVDCSSLSLAVCDGSAAQQFTFTSAGELVNQQNGGCLDVFGGSGPLVGIYACNDKPSQQWTVNTASKTILSNITTSVCLTSSVVSSNLAAYIYQGTAASDRLVFIVNTASSNANVTFEEAVYFVPAVSVTLLDENGVELFNTATVDTADVPSQRVYTVCCVIDGQVVTNEMKSCVLACRMCMGQAPSHGSTGLSLYQARLAL